MSYAESQVNSQLEQLILRVERLNEEKANIQADIREVFSEAKASGFDPKIMRLVIKLRAMEDHERQEQEALLDTYRKACGV